MDHAHYFLVQWTGINFMKILFIIFKPKNF